MGTKLYVGNLPFSITEEELKSTFGACGEVAEVRIIQDKMTGRSRGFGFVDMATEEGAAEAIQRLHDTELSGRKLVVNEARPSEPRERSGGPRGGGGGFGRGGRGGGGGGGGRRDDRW